MSRQTPQTPPVAGPVEPPPFSRPITVEELLRRPDEPYIVEPTPEEIAAFLPFVRAEIEIIQPECIVALGETAAEGLLGLAGNVTSMTGRWHDFEGTPARATYHPSHLLQSNGGNQTKRQLWEDMLAVMEKLDLPISEKQRGFFLDKS